MRNRPSRVGAFTRLATVDVPAYLAPFLPRWLVQLILSLCCTALALAARTAIDQLVPGGGSYSVIFPVMLLAVLLGGWVAGLLTLIFTLGYTWLVVMPAVHYFNMTANEQLLRLIVNGGCLVAALMLAEIFRRAVREALADRDQRISDTDLFLSEFEHRVKNNFASVAALLELQRKRATDDAVAVALAEARTRVESMARAHLHLYRDAGSVGTVDAKRYFEGLCEALGSSIFLPQGVALECDAQSVEIDRDMAIPLGLIANELVTNATKHAFLDRDRGTIRVVLRAEGKRLHLAVSDDGIGMKTQTRDGGLGKRLVDAFVRQVGGRMATTTTAEGSRFDIEVDL